MNPSRRLLTNVLAGLAASLAFAVAAQAQPASAPPVPIRGCTTYLQMSDAQAKIINTDVARVAQIRNEREGKIAELQMQQLKEEELRTPRRAAQTHGAAVAKPATASAIIRQLIACHHRKHARTSQHATPR